jgi:uncharacterized membrane protein YfcA
MTTPRMILFGALLLANLAFVAGWIRARHRYHARKRPTPAEVPIGFVVSFFDTLGIGSFAPTTAILKLRGDPPDEMIPGTLNVGLNLAAMMEASIFVTSVAVNPILLTSMVLSAAVGAWLGAGVVSRMPRRAIQLFMGIALLVAGGVFAATNLNWMPGGGTAMDLAGWKFPFAVAVNFVLGALMSVGIGLYAPCMILLALLGLHPLGAFPVMMGSCGLVQPVASLQFFRSGRFAWGTSIGLWIGSVGGVLLAAFVVKSLPLVALRWLVVGVVLYASVSMLRSFHAGRAAARLAAVAK